MAIPVATAIGAAVAFAFAQSAVALAVRVFVGLGFAVVTYNFVGPMWDDAVSSIASNLGGTSANIQVVLTLARVDDAIAVVLSFGFALLVLKGLNAVTGAVSRGRWKAPAA
jgi:hypothetical protein